MCIGAYRGRRVRSFGVGSSRERVTSWSICDKNLVLLHRRARTKYRNHREQTQLGSSGTLRPRLALPAQRQRTRAHGRCEKSRTVKIPQRPTTKEPRKQIMEFRRNRRWTPHAVIRLVCRQLTCSSWICWVFLNWTLCLWGHMRQKVSQLAPVCFLPSMLLRRV